MSELIPDNPNKPYDIRQVIGTVIDHGEFFEIQELFAQNIVVGFGRLAGRSVGIVANQPMHLAGCLDIDASIKASRFVRFCDAFNIPLITLWMFLAFYPDSDRNMVGSSSMVRNYFMHTDDVPDCNHSKAYGGASVMASNIFTLILIAFPGSEIAVMGRGGQHHL